MTSFMSYGAWVKPWTKSVKVNMQESQAGIDDSSLEAWARKFFEHWQASLRWRRLKPYEEFAQLIERHWDGIAAFCKPENKVSLVFVKGLNTKIRVLQRRAYGLRDEDYLKLKILTYMLLDFLQLKTCSFYPLAWEKSQYDIGR